MFYWTQVSKILSLRLVANIINDVLLYLHIKFSQSNVYSAQHNLIHTGHILRVPEQMCTAQRKSAGWAGAREKSSVQRLWGGKGFDSTGPRAEWGSGRVGKRRFEGGQGPDHTEPCRSWSRWVTWEKAGMSALVLESTAPFIFQSLSPESNESIMNN